MELKNYARPYEGPEDLYEGGDIPSEVYDDFTTEYEREKGQLNDSISALLADAPQLRREQVLGGERQILRREKSEIMDAVRNGVVSDDVGERLLDEIDLKLDRVRDGQTTVEGHQEGYEEFWRSRVEEYGLETGGESRPETASEEGAHTDE